MIPEYIQKEIDALEKKGLFVVAGLLRQSYEDEEEESS